MILSGFPGTGTVLSTRVPAFIQDAGMNHRHGLDEIRYSAALAEYTARGARPAEKVEVILDARDAKRSLP